MNRSLGLAAALALAGGAPFAHAAQAVRVDFARAVQMTLSTSPAMQASAADVRAARGAEQAASGKRWPQLSASLDAVRSNDPLTVFGAKLSQRNATFADFGAAQFTGPDSLDVAPEALNYPGAYDNFDTRLAVSWPLYAGGRMAAAVAGAHASLHAAQNGDVAARQAVVLDVLQTYEGVRAVAAEVSVAKRSEAAAQAYLASAEHRYEQGTAIKSDVLTARMNDDEARLARRNAEDQLATAREKLRVLLGLPAGTEIVLGPAAEPRMPNEPLAALQGEAEAGNPTLAALRQQAAASRAALAGERAAYKPSISLGASRDWNDRTPGFSGSSYTVAGVISWNIFDFGVRRGAVARASGEADAAQARAAAYAQQLGIAVDRSWRAARAAVDRIGVGEDAVAEAREAQRILKLRFDQGLATISDLLDAQARLDRAQADLIAARYALRVRRAELLQQLGRLDLDQFHTPAARTVAAPASVASIAGAKE